MVQTVQPALLNVIEPLSPITLAATPTMAGFYHRTMGGGVRSLAYATVATIAVGGTPDDVGVFLGFLGAS